MWVSAATNQIVSNLAGVPGAPQPFVGAPLLASQYFDCQPWREHFDTMIQYPHRHVILILLNTK